MSYQTGNQFDYLPRLHFWPTGNVDLDRFKIEGTQYLISGTYDQTGRYNKEFIKKYEQFDSPSGTFSF